MHILASPIGIAEHEIRACFVNAIAELFQTNLCGIVEIFLAVAVEAGGIAQGTIGRVKIEESFSLNLAEGFFKIAIHDFNVLQEFAVCVDDFFVTEHGTFVFAERNIEATFFVDSVQSVETRPVQEEKQYRIFQLAQ